MFINSATVVPDDSVAVKWINVDDIHIINYDTIFTRNVPENTLENAPDDGDINDFLNNAILIAQNFQ